MSTTNPGERERPLLIKSETCPACYTATVLLDRAGIDYTVLSNNDPAYDETVRYYGVRHVPTLVIDPGGQWQTLVGTEAIRGYAKG